MKNNQSSFAPARALVGLSVAALAAWGISYFSGFGFWVAFGIAVFAMLINGFIATIEDNAPGGFYNPIPPDPAEPPSEDANDKTHPAYLFGAKK